MRIVIEIDGAARTAASADESPETEAAAAEGGAPADGGAGPDASGAADTEDATAIDTGPPPDWLLEAVADAEAAGRTTATTEGGGDEGPADAGPAANG